MQRKSIIITLIIAVVGAGIISVSIIYSQSQSYSFGNPGCLDTVLNQANSRLYAAYYDDNAVVEIDTASMDQLRSFTVLHPTFMEMGPNDQYLYVMSHQSPGQLIRIRLTDGYLDQLGVDGQLVNLTLDASGNRIWVLHALYPSMEGTVSEEEAVQDENQDSGRLSEVNIQSFNVVSTVSIPTLPMSVLYSQYSDQLYVMHEFREVIPEQVGLGTGLGGSIFFIMGPQTLDTIGKGIWGKCDIIASVPAVPCYWSDDGRYLAFPNPGHGYPEFSIRVWDTDDDSVAFDLTFPDQNGDPLAIKYIHKVPGYNVLWAAVQQGDPAGYPENANTVIRIEPSTQQYSIFSVEGEKSAFADFAVSSNGRTLYLTHPWTGELIVWSPPNLEPVCSLSVITSMPASGIGQVPVEFDASGSYDPDPGDTLSFAWDFDGDNVYGETVHDSYTGDPDNPTHICYASYTGPVHVKVTDGHGGESICTVSVQVTVTNES